MGSLRTSRHGTLDRTIEWSWDLLDPASRDIATTIALFDHGLDPLFLDELWPEHDAVSLAQELESRSWIRVSEGMRGKAWSTLLAMRRFVRARISDENRVALEKRFAGWARAHLAELPGWWAFYVPEGLLAVKALMRDEAYADGAVLLGKLFFGAFGGTHFLEALNLAETLLNRMNRQVDSAAWAVLATKLSKGAFRYHSRHRAITWSGPAVEASPPRTTAHLAAMAQHVLCLIDIGHRNEASEILKMLVNDWPERPQDMSVVSALLDIAAVLHEMGDFEELRRTATAILAIARDAGNADAEARAWIHLSYASYDLGEFTRADEEIGHLNRLLKLRHPHERIAVGGAVAPLVALQLGRRAEAKAALIECEDVARRTHNASLDFYVELGWAEWSAREEPDLIRSHLDLALSSAHLQSSPKSVAHVRLLQTMEDLATSGFDLAAARVAALRHDGVVPAEFNKWHELLDAVEWFCQQQLAGKSGAPPSLFGELFEAVDACIGGDKQRLALLLAREPSSSWTVPGLYLLRLDDVASRLPSRIFRPGGARLSVEKNGLKFQVDDREIVDISRRQALKRILVHLAQRHRAGEVYSVSAHEVIEVGWPAEKILPAAALMRVYTTMNRMRSLGLGDLIITVEDGYALDAQVQIEWVDTL